MGLTYMCAATDKRVRDSYTPEAKTRKPRKPRAPKATKAKAAKPVITGRQAYASMPTMETFAKPKTAKRVIVPDAPAPKLVTERKKRMTEMEQLARLRDRQYRARNLLPL